MIKHKLQAGISVMEALVAILIFSVGFFALAQLSVSQFRESAQNTSRSEAILLAEQKIEEFRDYVGLTGTAGSNNDYDEITDTGSPETITGNNTSFSRSWTVTTSSSPNPEYKVVTVTVSWTDESGNARNVILSDVIYKNDPAKAAGIAG